MTADSVTNAVADDADGGGGGDASSPWEHPQQDSS